MRLYIQEKDSLMKFNLPATVDGSLLFSYKSSETGMDNSINIDASDGKWLLKSNGNINIIGNNDFTPEIVLSDYMCVPFSIVGKNGYLCLFSLPSIEQTELSYNIANVNCITIGSDPNNNIIYRQNMMMSQHAVIKLQNNEWFIAPAANNPNIYIR